MSKQGIPGAQKNHTLLWSKCVSFHLLLGRISENEKSWKGGPATKKGWRKISVVGMIFELNPILKNLNF